MTHLLGSVAVSISGTEPEPNRQPLCEPGGNLLPHLKGPSFRRAAPNRSPLAGSEWISEIEGMKLAKISRHLVKGMRPESLAHGHLIAGRGLEGDRAFAFQFMDEVVPEELRRTPAEVAPWMSKFFLAEQHDWPALARVTPTLVGEKLILSEGSDRISGSVLIPGERAAIAQWLEKFLARTQPFENARHPQLAPLRLIGSLDLAQRYTDGSSGTLSLMTLESLQDLEVRLGITLDWRIFRLNLLISGSPAAWSEADWKEKIIRIGDCEIRVLKPIARCPNIDVDPETGKRGPEIFPRLKAALGHIQVGMRAEVIRPGIINQGDAIEFVSS